MRRGKSELHAVALEMVSHAFDLTLVVVDADGQVVLVLGDPAGWLGVHFGEPSRHLTSMVPEGLSSTVAMAIRRAFRTGEPARYRGIACQPAGREERLIDVEVVPGMPTHAPPPAYALVKLAAAQVDKLPEDSDWTEETGSRLVALEGELREMRQNLKATAQELESTNEEQSATNEELMASNEELQTMNEELQSVNEELHTVNLEYQAKINELADLTLDHSNLISVVNLDVVYLDQGLSVRRFSLQKDATLRLLPVDVGRLFSERSLGFSCPDLDADLRRVLSTGKKIERDIQWGNRHIALTLHPYRQESDVPNGVIVTCGETHASHDSRERRESGFDSIDANTNPNAVSKLMDSKS